MRVTGHFGFIKKKKKKKKKIVGTQDSCVHVGGVISSVIGCVYSILHEQWAKSRVPRGQKWEKIGNFQNLWHTPIFLLYARLQTGRIMVWWCPSVRVSVRPTLRPSVISSVIGCVYSILHEQWAKSRVPRGQKWEKIGNENFQNLWHTPIFLLYARLQTGRIMVWWCPSVRVSVRPTLRPSVISSVIGCVYSILHEQWAKSRVPRGQKWEKIGNENFQNLWHTPIFLLYARLQTGRIMVWWCPSVRVSVRPTLRPSVRLSVRPTLRPSGSPSARFPHFSHTCFDILSWNFAHDFLLMYYRSSLSVVT